MFWFWYFLQHDHAEPEPRRFLARLFAVGILAAGVSIIVELFLSDYFTSVGIGGFDGTVENGTPQELFIAGLVEEIVKFLFLFYFVYFSRNFTQIRDGVIYGISLALGFVFFENTLYFFDIFLSDDATSAAFSIATVRAIGPLILHIVATGIVGLAIGRKKFSVLHKKSVVFWWLLFAMLLHGIFNVLILSASLWGMFFALVLIFGAFFFLIKKLAAKEVRMVWKLTKEK